MITENEYKAVNAQGLEDRKNGTMRCYYTPALRVAYNLGFNDGVDIKDVMPINALRFGKAPETFISTNWSANESEKGLSVYIDGDTVRSEFLNRKRYEYAGLPVGKGSDDEVLILAFDAENWD